LRLIVILTTLIICQVALASDINEIMGKAKQGSAISQYTLAKKYQYGFGKLAEDDSLAIKWMRKSAAQGYSKAQYDLGSMLSRGEGATKNYSQALEWFIKAANQGHEDHQRTLGKIYAAGEITPTDHKQAIYWLSKAARQGDSYAQSELAWSFRFVGNKIKAYSWWSIAVTEGSSFVNKWLNEVESEMTLEQIYEAQALATKCYESDYKDCD
jgi:TPR repeat protein